MNIIDKALLIQRLAIEISQANIALVTTDYFGNGDNMVVSAYPVGTFSANGRTPVSLLDEDIDLTPTRWISAEHIHQQLDHAIHQLQLLQSPAQSRTAQEQAA